LPTYEYLHIGVNVRVRDNPFFLLSSAYFHHDICRVEKKNVIGSGSYSE